LFYFYHGVLDAAIRTAGILAIVPLQMLSGAVTPCERMPQPVQA
jgi:hypothetical protein